MAYISFAATKKEFVFFHFRMPNPVNRKYYFCVRAFISSWAVFARKTAGCRFMVDGDINLPRVCGWPGGQPILQR